MTYPEPEAYNTPSEQALRRRALLLLCIAVLAAAAWFSWRAWPSVTGSELVWKTMLSAAFGFGLTTAMHYLTENSGSSGSLGLLKYVVAPMHVIAIVLGWLAILVFYPGAFGGIHFCALLTLFVIESAFLLVAGW